MYYYSDYTKKWWSGSKKATSSTSQKRIFTTSRHLYASEKGCLYMLWLLVFSRLVSSSSFPSTPSFCLPILSRVPKAKLFQTAFVPATSLRKWEKGAQGRDRDTFVLCRLCHRSGRSAVALDLLLSSVFRSLSLWDNDSRLRSGDDPSNTASSAIRREALRWMTEKVSDTKITLWCRVARWK